MRGGNIVRERERERVEEGRGFQLSSGNAISNGWRVAEGCRGQNTGEVTIATHPFFRGTGRPRQLEISIQFSVVGLRKRGGLRRAIGGKILSFSSEIFMK